MHVRKNTNGPRQLMEIQQNELIEANNGLLDAKGNVVPDLSHTQAGAAELWDNTSMVPSTSPLLPSYLCFLSPRKPFCRWFFLDLPCGTLPVDDLPCHLPWQLSETPL